MINEKRSKEKIPLLRIYTDGACRQLGNSGRGFGAWAFYVVRYNNYVSYDSCGFNDTTNQRMEIMAAAKGCEWAAAHRTKNEKVVIYCDSAYVVNAMTQGWLANWRRNGWVTSSGKDVANRDLWELLVPYYDNFWFSFVKVKGHDDIYWNIRVDELAVKTREEFEKNPRAFSGRSPEKPSREAK